MADREDILADMHGLLANTFLETLKDGEQIVLKDGEVVRIKPRAATLNVIRQFLKDNGIDAVPTEHSPLVKLAEEAGAVLPFPKKKVKP